MSKRIEQLLKDYPKLVQQRDCVAHQLAHFRGVSAEEVIESMYTPRMDGERVQSSNLSDKTAQIALGYEEKMERINREWYEHLEKQLQRLNDEIVLLESSLHSLSGKLSDIMWDMVVEGLTWNALCEKYFVSRTMIAKYRKKAISELAQIYEEHDKEAVKFMLDA